MTNPHQSTSQSSLAATSPNNCVVVRTLPKGTRRAIRRPQLKEIVPLADTTLWEMEQRGDFPRRFYLSPRCAAWDLDKVLSWLDKTIEETTGKPPVVAPMPDATTKRKRQSGN